MAKPLEESRGREPSILSKLLLQESRESEKGLVRSIVCLDGFTTPMQICNALEEGERRALPELLPSLGPPRKQQHKLRCGNDERGIISILFQPQH